MPLFAYRRLGLMLRELSDRLGHEKRNDLSVRLVHRDTKTALAAEAELAVLWAMSRVASVVTEPILPSSRSRPEAFSNDIFRSAPAVIEVRSLSDNSFSGKEAMDRTANIISGYADQLRKGSGKHLYFEFSERSYWKRRFHRERCIDPEFYLTEVVKSRLRDWIMAPTWPSAQRVRIAEGRTDVTVSWRKATSRLYRTFCSMPSIAYDAEDNPIYKALKSKSSQLRGVGSGALRCVVLFDAGCSLLRRVGGPAVPGVHEVSPEVIIRHALAKLSIDVVIVLSPSRKGGLVAFQSAVRWNCAVFDRRDFVSSEEYSRIEDMVAQLPIPRFEGYEARDLHRQGRFSLGRAWYSATTTSHWKGGKMAIKLSANLLHEYLACRIDAGEFKRRAFGDHNFFDTALASGKSVRNVQFESGGVDLDDDYVVFDLDVDQEKTIERLPAGVLPEL